MASTFTPLGVELMATGENAGTWGTKTNTNLSLISQLTGGFAQVSIAGGAQTTALTIVDGNTTGTAQQRMIEFTGTITGNQIVTIPLDVETFYILRNSTSGAHTVQFKYVSGSGGSVTFSTTDKGDKIVFAKADDGTNPNIIEIALGLTSIVEDTSPQLGGDLDMNGNDIVTTSNANIDLNPNGSGVVNLVANSTRAATLRFNEDTDDGSNYVELKAGTISSNLTFTLPTADGSADQVLKTDGSGALSFGSAGTAWQAVKTTSFTAAAGEGYFINTTSSTITMTLPASPSIGDEVSFIDYAGKFGTNTMTVGRNSENIQGTAADLTVSVDRAANTLVYTDGTQGWLLKSN